MKSILIELDDRCARDLERVAPSKKRRRAEFIRLAIRSAIDRALEPRTEAAYRAHPLRGGGISADDLAGWDPGNELASPPAKARARAKERTRAA